MNHAGSCFCEAVKLVVLRMRDGLPKLRDFPAEMGGSGEAVAE
jgi:hypothetical protein